MKIIFIFINECCLYLCWCVGSKHKFREFCWGWKALFLTLGSVTQLQGSINTCRLSEECYTCVHFAGMKAQGFCQILMVWGPWHLLQLSESSKNSSVAVWQNSLFSLRRCTYSVCRAFCQSQSRPWPTGCLAGAQSPSSDNSFGKVTLHFPPTLSYK